MTSESERSLKTLNLEEEERLLLTCLGSLLNDVRPDSSLFRYSDRFDWEKFSASVRLHSLSPLFAYLSRQDSGLPRFPESLLERMEEDHKWSLYRNVLLQGHLRLLLDAFQDHGMPVIVLTGSSHELMAIVRH